jgi:hypothetical protein
MSAMMDSIAAHVGESKVLSAPGQGASAGVGA